MRSYAMATADKLGAGDPLRALRLSLAPHYVRRDKLDNEHLKSILGAVLDEDSNCLDVGCHGGQFLAAMARCAPKGSHIAYEPLPELYAELVARFPGVDIRRAALSTKPGMTTFTRVVDALGYSGIRSQDYPRKMQTESIEVDVESIDQSLPSGWVPRLIKIDVEGAEHDVVLGGIETIAAHRPIVVFEFHRGSARHYGSTPEKMHGLLCGRAGLRIFDIDGGGPYTVDGLERAFNAGRVWNFVAHR